MPSIDKLPGPEDGVEGLYELARVFGDEQVFQFIRLCRLDQGEGKRPGAEALSDLGMRMVRRHMEENAVEEPGPAGPVRVLGDYDTARQDVAGRLGYTKASFTNFYRILRGESRRSIARPGPGS